MATNFRWFWELCGTLWNNQTYDLRICAAGTSPKCSSCKGMICSDQEFLTFVHEHTSLSSAPNSPEANFGSSLRHITEHPVPERWSVCPQILIFCTWSGQFANRRAAKASNLISTMHEIPCIHPYFTHLLSIHKKHQLIINKSINISKFRGISISIILVYFGSCWRLTLGNSELQGDHTVIVKMCWSTPKKGLGLVDRTRQQHQQI